MKRFESKVALVTGGSRGIGAAIARKLASEGARVVVNYAQGEAAALEVVSAIESSGGQALAVRADLARPEAAATLVEAAVRQYGRLDILVNNAAIFSFQPLGQIDVESCTATLELNLRAPLLLAQHAMRHMREGGRIINLSSNASMGRVQATSAYAATKAGLEALTRLWAVELGPRGITVNAVAPGVVETDMSRGFLDGPTREFICKSTPLGRIGQPEDIADVVAFLASEASRWVTGQVIFANGGYQP